jgi:hypothetical protein
MTRQVSVIARRVTICALFVATSAAVCGTGQRSRPVSVAATIAEKADSTHPALPKPDKPSGPTFYDPPDAYDLAAIQANPAAYYARSVPSRVWQIAPTRAGEPAREDIMVLAPPFRFVEANSHKPVPITVRAKAGRPVTFTALDTGRFANGRISITVPADQDGYAKADFWVGDAGDFRVLAGSPENKGPAEFTMQALPRDGLSAVESGKYAEQYRAKFAKGPQASKLAPHPQAPAAPVKESAAKP